MTVDHFSQNLSRAIERSGRDRSEIAERAGLSLRTLNSYMQGSLKISLEDIIKLSSVLDVNMHDLLGISEGEQQIQKRIDELKAGYQQRIAALESQLEYATRLIREGGVSKRDRGGEDCGADNASSGLG